MSDHVVFRTEAPRSSVSADGRAVPPVGSPGPEDDGRPRRLSRLRDASTQVPWRPTMALGVVVAVLAALFVAGPALTGPAMATIAVFGLAVWFWVFTPISDTYVALGAAVILALLGVSDASVLFSSLGDDTMWLLIAAFIIAAGIASSGLATRAAAFMLTGARGPRSLVHLVTAALTATAFAVPATSGRAALAIPVFLALAAVLAHRPQLVRMLSLLFPTVILLSAVASLIGAGAHLITSQMLVTAGYPGFDYAGWLIYGLPLAIVSSHLAAELVLWLFTDGEERGTPLSVSLESFDEVGEAPVTGPPTVAQTRGATLLLVMVVLWSTEALHGVAPALVALLGALVVTSPRFGGISLGTGLKNVPWNLLLFMAATVSLGEALTGSGAASALAEWLLGPIPADSIWAGPVFVVAVIVLSALSHLVIQSRSARSAVLIPIVVSLAPQMGVNPVAVALISTAAAGVCHTLPSSAKPVTMFSGIEGHPTFEPPDLLRLSAWLTPLMCLVFVFFAFVVWPIMGLPLFDATLP